MSHCSRSSRSSRSSRCSRDCRTRFLASQSPSRSTDHQILPGYRQSIHCLPNRNLSCHRFHRCYHRCHSHRCRRRSRFHRCCRQGPRRCCRSCLHCPGCSPYLPGRRRKHSVYPDSGLARSGFFRLPLQSPSLGRHGKRMTHAGVFWQSRVKKGPRVCEKLLLRQVSPSSNARRLFVRAAPGLLENTRCLLDKRRRSVLRRTRRGTALHHV